MSNEERDQKLNAYFGFVRRKRCAYVGEKLQEMLSKHKINLLLLLPSCSEKNEAKLKAIDKDNPSLTVYRYEGTYDVKGALNYALLNAVGIADENLSKAILKVLQEEKEPDDNK